MKDQPGVLGEIAGLFGKYQVSIAAVIQKEWGDKTAPLIFVTHEASELSSRKRFQKFRKMRMYYGWINSFVLNSKYIVPIHFTGYRKILFYHLIYSFDSLLKASVIFSSYEFNKPRTGGNKPVPGFFHVFQNEKRPTAPYNKSIFKLIDGVLAFLKQIMYFCCMFHPKFSGGIIECFHYSYQGGFYEVTGKNHHHSCSSDLSASMYISPVLAAEGKNVFVDSKLLAVQAFEEGTAMIPAEEFCRISGSEFMYNHDKMTATITKENMAIELALDSVTALINGKPVTMPSPMKISGRRVMIPMEFIADVFNKAVYRDSFRDRWLVLTKENSDLFYTIESGDTLWKLSVTFQTTTAKLMQDNHLSDTMLWVGQRLKVATGLTQTQTLKYTVLSKSIATLFAKKACQHLRRAI